MRTATCELWKSQCSYEPLRDREVAQMSILITDRRQHTQVPCTGEMDEVKKVNKSGAREMPQVLRALGALSLVPSHMAANNHP